MEVDPRVRHAVLDFLFTANHVVLSPLGRTRSEHGGGCLGTYKPVQAIFWSWLEPFLAQTCLTQLKYFVLPPLGRTRSEHGSGCAGAACGDRGALLHLAAQRPRRHALSGH